MSAVPATLAHEKEALLLRSAVCRLRLRRDTHALRATLDWKRGLLAAASAAPVRQLAFGIGIAIFGAGRAARLVALTGRVVLAVKLLRAIATYARRRPAAATCAVEQTGARIARSL